MSLLSLFKTPGKAISPRQKTGWIGVDIGTGAIKIAQMQRAANKLRLVRSLVIRADEQRPFDLQSFESGRIGSEIRSGLKTHGGFQGQEVACVVSMAHCELRTLVSAKGSEDDQRELISLEIENDLNGSTEPLEFEFWDASTGEYSENRGMTQLHVLSLPRTFSDSIANSLLQAGLHCQVLDAIPFAAVRASEMSTPLSATHVSAMPAIDSSYAILDWGYSVATMMIVHQGQPFMTRTLKHCGLQKVLRAVSQRLKLSAAESEAMLTTYGVATNSQEAGKNTDLQSLTAELCSGVITDLVEEIHETIDFIKMQFSKQMPSHVCLIGGGAAIRNVDSLLRQKIRLPVHSWTFRSSSTESVSPVFATAAALSALAWEL